MNISPYQEVPFNNLLTHSINKLLKYCITVPICGQTFLFYVTEKDGQETV